MLNYKNQFFFIMLVLCAGYTVSQFLRTSIGVLSPNLMNDFNINPNNMGLLGGVFFLSFALFQIPAGLLIDSGKSADLLESETVRKAYMGL